MARMHYDHETYLRRCIDLAQVAKQNGNTPVGSLVVFEGEIIGEGIEQLPKSLSVTGHAEIIACQQAVNKVGNEVLRGASLYSTAEPCYMCSYVIRRAEITQVVYGLDTPTIGGATSEFSILTSPVLEVWKPAVSVLGGVLAAECTQFRSE